MQTVIKNRFKQSGIFRCHHPAHARFGYDVSPYHVLECKRCYPAGCVEFLWRCNIYGKRMRCPRGYRHVGRNCFTCQHYREEKICRQPEVLVGELQLHEFLSLLDDYRRWLTVTVGRRVSFSGTIDTVQPALAQLIDGARSTIHHRGFLIAFARGHIGYDLFDDRIYLWVKDGFLRRWPLAPGDYLELEAAVAADRGRVVLHSPSRVQLEHGGASPTITPMRAIVGRATGAIVQDDIAPCRGCPYGALIDVYDRRLDQIYRRFYCLRGVKIAANCPVRLRELLLADRSTNNQT